MASGDILKKVLRIGMSLKDTLSELLAGCSRQARFLQNTSYDQRYKLSGGDTGKANKVCGLSLEYSMHEYPLN
ncbi:hypothetical protein [Peribacillus deserti]|uniref:Uncharacterized protein n=1 Tax=Peribacillus deserti TaxID=673318 RepID=A0A2N5M184_9BACI|nr:hypothetical protein [Peribacillus deserti]PLT28112.1 hypothetical protein CUU66_20105 [Peribacillus deserti]